MSVGLINISKILNERPDVATCCKSNNINQWSFHKPINHESEIQISDIDYYAANDGFNLFIFYTPQRMLYELQHPNASNIWQYTERVEPYRLTDFDQYDHYAPTLCQLTWENNNSGPVGTTLKLYCTDFMDMIHDWAIFEGVRSYVDLVLLFFPHGTEYDQSETQGIHCYKVSSIVDYDGDGDLRFRIPSGISEGVYDIIFCLSTATTTLGNGDYYYINSINQLIRGNWYALPHHCKQTFTVTNSGSGGGGSSTDWFNYLDIDFRSAQYNYSNLQITDLSFINYIVIGTSTNKTFNLYIEYWYDNANTPVKVGTASRTLNEDDIPWATITIEYNNTINVVTDANLDDRIAIRAEISLTVEGVGYHKTINTTIEKE